MSTNSQIQPRFSVPKNPIQDRNRLNKDYRFINYIDEAKKLINKSELVESEFYISLCQLASNMEINDKLSILSLKSFIYFKEKNEMLNNSVQRKVMKLLEERDKITKENCISFIRIFYRCGCIFQGVSKYFLALQCFYFAKKLIMEVKEKDPETKELIEKQFLESVKEIQSIVDLAKTKLIKNDEILKKLRQISYSIDIKETTDGQPCFIISTQWLTFFLSFIQQEMNEKLFDLNKVCILNFQEDNQDKLKRKKVLGKYPGPINNYHLLDFKNFWFDPDLEFQHTNMFLKHNVKENTDFILVNHSIFDKLYSFFGCNYQIQRNNVVFDNHVILDVYLKRFKIFVCFESLYKTYKNHFCVKEIQFGKNETVLNLKEKIIRCLNYIMLEKDKIELKSCDFKIYIPQLDEKKEEILRCIVNCGKNDFFNFSGEEIKNDNELIYNLKVSPKEILLVEIKINKTQQWLLHLQKELKTYNCFYCKKDIEDVIRCNFCIEYYYCSSTCRSKDENHIFYHKNINNSSKSSFNPDELSPLDIFKILDNTSAGGLSGLKNLGNTCFMSSALQCLSHATELTLYFLLNKYSYEINRVNNQGTCGKMAEAYYELMKELWLGNKTVISPWDFRQIFVSFSKQFADFSQQDSHEMLVYVLDHLHEDLCRVKEKPYLEVKEKDINETEDEASIRYWSSYMKREDSIITDLFHGQYKSEIKCLKCGYVSVTFDPFIFLSLPIPNTNFSIKIKFFYENPFKGMILIDFIFTEQSTVFDLKEFVLTKLKEKAYLIVMLTKDLQFKQILKDSETLMPFLESNDFELIIYETNYSIEDHDNKLFVCSPTKFIEETSFLFMKKQVQKQIMYPKPFIICKDLKVIDIYFEVFKYYRNVFPDIDRYTSLEDFKSKFEKDDDYIEKEFHIYRRRNDFLQIFILNNISESSTDFEKKKCEFCGQNCPYCYFNFTDDILIESIYNKLRNRKIFILLINFPSQSIKLKEDIMNKYTIVRNSCLSVYNCLQSFREGEKLDRDNSWYCSKCKKNQESMKKIDIYRFPKLLIFHLKRFRNKNVNFGIIQNQKNVTLVEYPLENLMISQINSDKNHVYDLFAVSCHTGTISSGHYTAMCKNKDNWYMFDDSSVYKVSSSSVTCQSAYILFYRKKN